MSSINRSLAGPMLTFDLERHLDELRSDEAYRRSGRAGRTLAKSGRMRITLTAMATGNVISTHRADSPMTVHVLKGHIRYKADGQEQELRAGQLLFFGPGDAHDITATEESVLLLTLSAIGDDHLMDEPDERQAPRRGEG